jgi:release factor glutamine methyltransferase
VPESPKEWSISEILNVTANWFAKKNPGSAARLDAEILLAKVMNLPRVSLYVSFEKKLTEGEVSAYRELVRRRGSHEPAAYILGEKEFYNTTFKADRRALIPRPETEHLVDEALLFAKESKLERPLIADIGCGCGAVALSLAKSLPGAELEASDISEDALALARENAEALGLSGRVSFRRGDLLDAPLGAQSSMSSAPTSPTSRGRTWTPFPRTFWASSPGWPWTAGRAAPCSQRGS